MILCWLHFIYASISLFPFTTNDCYLELASSNDVFIKQCDNYNNKMNTQEFFIAKVYNAYIHIKCQCNTICVYSV